MAARITKMIADIEIDNHDARILKEGDGSMEKFPAPEFPTPQNSDPFSITSAQKVIPLQDEVRLCYLGDDHKKAQDHIKEQRRCFGAHGAIGEWKNYSPKFAGRSSDWCANQGGSITYNDQPYSKFLKSSINLDNALLEVGQTYTDPGSGLNLHELTELLDQKLDSEFISVAKYGYCDVMIAIAETGWPLDGDLTQHGANRENAAV
ncbi:probable glucan endo-1,3-beta-glucosidase A6 [Tanacetum coccineum]